MLSLPLVISDSSVPIDLTHSTESSNTSSNEEEWEICTSKRKGKQETKTSANNIQLQSNCSLNMTTITGYLLGFPVLYVHGEIPSTSTPADNCLSMLELKRYIATATWKWENNQVYPSSCSSMLNEELIRCLVFSVPSCVQQELLPCLNVFCSRFQNSIELSSSQFSSSQWSEPEIIIDTIVRPQIML